MNHWGPKYPPASRIYSTEHSIPVPALSRSPPIGHHSESYDKWMKYVQSAVCIQSHIRGRMERVKFSYMKWSMNKSAVCIQRKVKERIWEPNSNLVRRLEFEFNGLI